MSDAARSLRPERPPGSRPLHELLRGLSAAEAPPPDGSAVRGVASDSRAVRPGSLFVAVRGSERDGHDYIPQALARGAAALVVERWPEKDVRVPVIRVPDARRALAELAAAWHGHPAERLRLVGISGTLGKTSVLAILEAMLSASRRRVAGIGSLGVHAPGRVPVSTGFTAPDPLLLHAELARLAAEGCELAAMEVTSHALVQERVHGLSYELGIFTNLLPLEHADYHGNFRAYTRAKRRFFEHLRPGAPLVYNVDDCTVRRLVRGYDVRRVGCGSASGAAVRVEALRVSAAGTRLTLEAGAPLPRAGGGTVPPFRLRLDVPLLGRGNVMNVALAAAAAVCLGTPPGEIPAVAAALNPARRRMEILHQGRFTLIDDTVGHPDSISALFEVVEKLVRPARHLRVAWVVRGRRGPAINRRCAETLAVWARRLPLETLAVTRSAEAADARNRVGEEEYRAFLGPLRASGLEFEEHERLDSAVVRVLESAQPGDVVLLLGAQGMDSGAGLARRWLAGRAAAPGAAGAAPPLAADGGPE